MHTAALRGVGFLLRSPVHPTVDEIFREINRADPRASRATVYNNLRTLMEAGLVREFVHENRSARFGAQVEKEIAAILHISQRTVESHKYEMMEMLGLATTAALIQYAIRVKMVSS